MSLDDIKLSPFLVEKLYKNSLIDDTISSTSVDNTKIAKDEKKLISDKTNVTKEGNFDTIKYLGKNAKNRLIKKYKWFFKKGKSN